VEDILQVDPRQQKAESASTCPNFARYLLIQRQKLLLPKVALFWADVDKAAAEHELAVVGGTVNTTGVGGLTL